MLGVKESYKYLGLQFGCEEFQWQPAREVLTIELREISSAPLNAGQRLYIVRYYLIPRLIHVLVLAMAPGQFLVNMDRLVRASATSWLGITCNTALGLLQGGIGSVGLKVPRMDKVLPLLQMDKFQSLKRSTGEDKLYRSNQLKVY